MTRRPNNEEDDVSAHYTGKAVCYKSSYIPPTMTDKPVRRLAAWLAACCIADPVPGIMLRNHRCISAAAE